MQVEATVDPSFTFSLIVQFLEDQASDKEVCKEIEDEMREYLRTKANKRDFTDAVVLGDAGGLLFRGYEMGGKMKRTCEEAFTILKNVNKALDCTYPDKELANKIGFNKNVYACINAFLASRSKIMFNMHVPYEGADEVLVDIDDEIFDKYL